MFLFDMSYIAIGIENRRRASNIYAVLLPPSSRAFWTACEHPSGVLEEGLLHLFRPLFEGGCNGVGYIAPLLHYHCSYMVNPIKGFLILLVLLKQRQTNFQSDNLLGLLEIRYYRLKRPVLFCGPVVFAI